MTEGIHQRFAANTVDFIAEDRVQSPGPPFNNDTKSNLLPNLLMDDKFLLDTGKCLFEIKRVTVSIAESSHCAAALFNDLLY